MTWKFETAGPDVGCRLFGVNIFRFPWRDCGEVADVTDPHHGTKKRFRVYEVTIEGQPRRFAAGEFSQGIFGFYLPEE